MKFELFNGPDEFKIAYSHWYNLHKKDIRPDFTQLNKLYKEAQNIKFGDPEFNYSNVVEEINYITPSIKKEKKIIKEFMNNNDNN